MTISSFPPVEEANEFGLIAIGGDLDVDSLLLAYRSGIFPWPLDRRILTWFAPPKRAILWLKDFHISHSLRKKRKSGNFSFSVDQALEQVIRSCAQYRNRKGQTGTWITPEIIEAYIAFHRAGFCHSIECWHKGIIAGGLYGIAIGGMFAGESMFHDKSDASKLALWFLVEYLKKRDVSWIDCQVMTPFLESLGAVEIARPAFTNLLRAALTRRIVLFD